MRRGGFADPEHLNLRRVEAALAAGTQKERNAKSVSFFLGSP